ncbi:hypothetical protein Tco_1549143 [Tanacetum coccineum]
MCTYLKNMEGYELKDLKLKEFDVIQEMFDKIFKRVNTFEDFRIELVEGKEKRAGIELVQEKAKKQKMKDDKETTKLKPAEVTDDSKWAEMDGSAIANLHLALEDGVLSSIEEKKTAKEIWDHLARLYEARSLHNKIFLKRKLYALRMTESTSVTEHINTLNSLFSQLTSLSCIIEPKERAEILLQSLPDSYDQLIISLAGNVLTNFLVFDDVAAAVLEEENRRNNREDRHANSRQVEALVVTRK